MTTAEDRRARRELLTHPDRRQNPMGNEVFTVIESKFGPNPYKPGEFWRTSVSTRTEKL